MSKRLLFIACRLPFPLDDGWKIRTFNLLKGLALTGHTIDFVTFLSHEREKEHFFIFKPYCSGIHAVLRDKRYKLSSLVQGIFSSTPFSVLNYRERQMQELISRLLKEKRYDVIQVEDVVMAQYLPPNGGAEVKVLDMHNVESHLLERYARHETDPLRQIYALLTARKLRKYELAVSRYFDAITVCSDEDKRLLSNNGVDSPIVVVPNGVDCSYYGQAMESCPTADDSMVFVGSMDYHANISAVIYFVREILPHILARHPRARFHVVGKNPPREVVGLAGAHVVVTGAVADVRPYIASAKVVVAPLLVGGGTRLKILEAMAMAKPVVSTPVGCEGIDVADGENICIEHDPLRFAEVIARLMGDADERKEIGTRARHFVLNRYDWKKITDSMPFLLKPGFHEDRVRSVSVTGV